MKLDVSLNLKRKCWNFLSNNNMGKRHSANGNKEQQLVGLIGEVLTKKVFGIEHKYKSGFDGGFDLTYKGKRVDIKTMGRTVDMKPHYVHNFISFQEVFDCDIYVFSSLNKKNSRLEICGWISKEDLLDKAYFYKKGVVRTRDDGSTFEMRADTYELENKHLNDINQLI